MKNLFILLAMILVHVVHGQQVYFRGLAVDTINIRSSSGHYSLKKNGPIGRTDVYTIIFNKRTHVYNISKYKKLLTKGSFESDTSNKLRTRKTKIVSMELLNNLLTALSSKSIIPVYENFGLDKQTFLSLTNEKHVRDFAKKTKQNLYLKYATKEETRAFWAACHNTDTFSLFLSSSFKPNVYAFAFDFWDDMYIYISAAGKHYPFSGLHPNIAKIPWYDHTSDTATIKGISNFGINESLLKILPKHFYRIETIQPETLTNKYIDWFLKRKETQYLNTL